MFMVQEKEDAYKKDGSIKEIYLRKYNEFKELLENERAEDNNIVDQESN